jgi:hypothetical protein
MQIVYLLKNSIKLKIVHRRVCGNPLEDLHGARGHREAQFWINSHGVLLYETHRQYPKYSTGIVGLIQASFIPLFSLRKCVDHACKIT